MAVVARFEVISVKKFTADIKKIIKINHENLWVIGTVGAIPQLFIVNDDFRNVPEVAVGCWPLRTPGATAPQSNAIDQG